jgi:nanoRNase/pAp phosphatase (c-di-AMP/oligoRNAs hydrolase)
MFVMTLCGRSAMIVFADRFVSELGNTLCEKYPEYDLAVIIDPGACKVSYRTIKDDVDVGKIATLFSGGGHPKSAGHIFNTLLRKDIARSLFFYHIETYMGEPKPEKKKSFWKRKRDKK